MPVEAHRRSSCLSAVGRGDRWDPLARSAVLPLAAARAGAGPPVRPGSESLPRKAPQLRERPVLGAARSTVVAGLDVVEDAASARAQVVRARLRTPARVGACRHLHWMTRRCPLDGNASNRRRLVSGTERPSAIATTEGPNRGADQPPGGTSAPTAPGACASRARGTPTDVDIDRSPPRTPRRPASALARRYSPVATPAAAARPRHHGADNGQRIGVGRQRHL